MKTMLKDKWVLITGASSGFGAAAARAFGAEGAKLLLGARRLDRLEKVAAEALQAGAPEAHFHAWMFQKHPALRHLLPGQIQNPIPRPAGHQTRVLHVLINNAGGAHGLDPVAEGKDADWETMLQTNVLGVLRMTRAALPLMPQDAGATLLTSARWRATRPTKGRGLLRGQGGRTANHPGLAVGIERHRHPRQLG